MGRRGVTWCQRRGVTWWWWCWYLLIFFQQEMNHLSGYCFPSMIRKFANLTSNMRKGILDGFWIEVNEVDENWFFGGRQQKTVHGVLEFVKSFRFLLLKMQLSGGCLLCCFLFCLLLFSPILVYHSVLRYFSSGKIYSRAWIMVPHVGFIFYQYHLYLFIYDRRVFFLHILNRDDCYFSHSIICCSLENNVPWWLLHTLCSEDNHRIISPGNL